MIGRVLFCDVCPDRAKPELHGPGWHLASWRIRGSARKAGWLRLSGCDICPVCARKAGDLA